MNLTPMDATKALTILEGMGVEEGWPGVYVLGCLDRRVTIYSQQVRALNLAAALVASKRVEPGETVVVVGAGAAGLTCAAGLQHLGAKVVVLEAKKEILPLFRLGATRWLHPRVYDWPFEGWDRCRAGLPLLDWEHGTVEKVRKQLEERWTEAGAGVDVRFEVGKVSIGAQGQRRRKVVWDGDFTRTGTVVLAIGFGLERTELSTERRYWEADDLDHPLPADAVARRWLVSGCGDGALTDLFRLCIEGFRHDQTLHEFTRDPRMKDTRLKIRHIEDSAEIQADAEKLNDAYAKFEAHWVMEALDGRRRPHEVKLATETSEFLTRGASPLNRFLAGQLAQAKWFTHVPHRVSSVQLDHNELVVQYGDKTAEKFDRVLRRHGPASALAAHFPLVAEAFAAKHASRRAEPTLTDQTRERLWVEGTFGPEVRRAGGKALDGGTIGKNEAHSQPMIHQSVEEPELDNYLAKIDSLHCDLPLVGFETKLRASMGLEELYEPLDAVLSRSVQRTHVFKNSEEAEEPDTRVELARVFEVARERGVRSVVLLGDPGSGKTTHLKQVLLQVVRKGPETIGLPRGTVPVFLPLRRLHNLDAGLLGFIMEELRDPLLDVDAGFGQRLCKRGKLLFLLDGLDEVTKAEDRQRVARWIDDARHASEDNYFLLSCRFSGYTLGAHLDEGFLELHLRPMCPEQVERFVRKWYRTVERASSSDLAQAEAKAKAGADDLLAALTMPEKRSTRVYTMTQSPLLLTTICLVHRARGTLPEKRVVLYEEAASAMLERWRNVSKDLDVTFSPPEALQMLMPVASWMHENGRIQASVEELEGPTAEGLRGTGHADIPARAFLEAVRDEKGLLTGWGDSEFGFIHLGFQEYLVALAIQAQVLDDPDVLVRLAKRFDESWWHEVILLLLAQDRPPVFKRFMSELLKHPNFPKWARSQLMWRCCAEALAASPEPFVKLLQQTNGGPTLGARQLAAAELLGQWMPAALVNLGVLLQDHPAEHVRQWWRIRAHGTEDMVTKWVHGVELVLVPGGRFEMGSPDEEEGRSANESPKHEVELKSFWLARTPVTNAQYREYMTRNAGVMVPRLWADRRYNEPEQPVVGVSWREAKAYCEWAGFSLPTEAQWEHACRAGKPTRYCIGDGEEDLRMVGWYAGNSGRQLHAVRELLPNKWGLYDMHGNIWEWCEDAFGSYNARPRNETGLRHEPVDDSFRVMRGGDFDDDIGSARSAARGKERPDARWAYVGFRPAQSRS